MRRSRVPGGGSHYVTPAGLRRLRAELDQLWRVERPALTQSVAEAAAMGDRSENAEYIYGRKRLREIDRRIRHLRKRLDGMVVVDRPPTDRSRVYFGAWVELAGPDGQRRRHRIVGPDEFDMAPGYISMDSPLARALLGRRSGDELEIELPAGPVTVSILSVDYPAGDGA